MEAPTTRATPVEELLDRLSERLAADRWVACWRDARGWLVRSSRHLGRDDLLVEVAGGAGIEERPGLRYAHTDDLGDVGGRLADAGVGSLLMLGGPEHAVVFFENPDPDRARRFTREPAVRAGDLAVLLPRALEEARRARELAALAGWLPSLEEVLLGTAEEAAALESLGEATEHRQLAAIYPLPPGIGVVAVWSERGEWRRVEGALTGMPWGEAWADPEAAVRAAAAASGAPPAHEWSTGRATDVERPFVIGLAAGEDRPSPEALDLFASMVSGAILRRGASTRTRNEALLAERTRIASMIHEGLTQVITNVAIQLELLDQVLDDPQQARSAARSARSAVLEALDSLRAAIFELTPPQPEWTDLAEGLGRYVADYGAQWGMLVAYTVEGEPRDVGGEVLGLAFAFVQEGLTNIRKHSGAERAEVLLRFADGDLTVRVCDRGSGFDPAAAERAGFWEHHGLSLTRARIRMLRGRFEIESSPGRGTCIAMEVPATASGPPRRG